MKELSSLLLVAAFTLCPMAMAQQKRAVFLGSAESFPERGPHLSHIRVVSHKLRDESDVPVIRALTIRM